MPKMTDRDRLAELETRQRRIAEEVETARLAVRARYASLFTTLPVEQWSERDWKSLLDQAMRVGATAAIAALTALP